MHAWYFTSGMDVVEGLPMGLSILCCGEMHVKEKLGGMRNERDSRSNRIGRRM